MALMADQLAEISRGPRKTTGSVPIEGRQPPHVRHMTIDHRPGQLTTVKDLTMVAAGNGQLKTVLELTMVADEAATTFRTVADHPKCSPAAADRPRVSRTAAAAKRCLKIAAGSRTCSDRAAGRLITLGRAMMAEVVVAAAQAAGHSSRLQWLLVAEHLRAGGSTTEIWMIGMANVAIHGAVAIISATPVAAAMEPVVVLGTLMMVP